MGKNTVQPPEELKGVKPGKDQLRGIIHTAALQLFNSHGRRFQPLYPWILLYVLPKRMKVGSIVLPDKHNKPNHEAVVLRTYAPFDKLLKSESGKETWLPTRSQAQPGDHVVIPHFQGLPLFWTDEKEFRVVKDEDITCVLEYTRPGEAWLQADEILDKFGVHVKEGLEELRSNFFLVPRRVEPLTTSGVGQAE